MTWPTPESILAELRKRDAGKRARYGNAPLSEWPVQVPERPPRPVRFEVASEREMQMHAREIARLQDSQRTWRRR